MQTALPWSRVGASVILANRESRSPGRAEKESLLAEQAPGTGAGRQSSATPDLVTLRIAVSLGLVSSGKIPSNVQ